MGKVFCFEQSDYTMQTKEWHWIPVVAEVGAPGLLFMEGLLHDNSWDISVVHSYELHKKHGQNHSNSKIT